MTRKILAEALGALLLTACVVGSGIMAERLAAGNAAVALLANTLATVAALATLIVLFGPVSGAHFNPAISAVALYRRQIEASTAAMYVVAQIVGCCAGAMLANAMFELPLVNLSSHARHGPAQWLSEFVATVGLLLVINGCVRTGRGDMVAVAVGVWIGGAYWFTSSTSFANPAVTIGRTLTDTFAGIAPASVPMFVVMQLAGALAAWFLIRLLFPTAAASSTPTPTARSDR